MLSTLIIESYYLHFYYEKVEKSDRYIKAAIALTSSTSIASWAIWADLSYLWAVLIAASQVLTTVLPYMQISARKSSLLSMKSKIGSLKVYAEENWINVSAGDLSDQETKKINFAIERKKTKILTDSLGSATLPWDNEILKKSEEAAEIYLQKYQG